MGFWEELFYTEPAPGECDDGWLVECCTDLAGLTICGPTWRAVAVPPLGVAALVQQWIQEWKQQDLTLGEAYALAQQRGYKGSEGEFARQWNPEAGSPDTPGGGVPALVTVADVPALATGAAGKLAEGVLPTGDWGSYIGVGLAGLAGGAVLAYVVKRM